MRGVMIIANPIAGGGRAAVGASRLGDVLSARGIAVDLRMTAKAADAASFAAEADPGRFDAVVSVGGDGTLNTVFDNLPDPTLPLAMMPFGTANVIAKELRLPRSADGIADALMAGNVIEAAIGIATPHGPDAPGPRRFLLFAGVGLDGAMVEELERLRKGTLGKLLWFRPVLRVVRRLPHYRLSLETDCGEVREGLTEVLVTRVRSYGGVFWMPDAIDIADGLLHVVCFRQDSRWRWFCAALRAFLGRLREGRDVERLTARRLVVGSDAPVPYHVDGDFGGRTPVTIELDPRKARLVAPPRRRL